VAFLAAGFLRVVAFLAAGFLRAAVFFRVVAFLAAGLSVRAAVLLLLAGIAITFLIVGNKSIHTIEAHGRPRNEGRIGQPGRPVPSSRCQVGSVKAHSEPVSLRLLLPRLSSTLRATGSNVVRAASGRRTVGNRTVSPGLALGK